MTPNEYHLLEGVEGGYVPDPAHSLVIVAQQQNEIVGRVLLIRPFHVEGTWIAERFRKGTVGVRMFKLLDVEAKKLGLSNLLAFAATEEVEGYVQRLGYERLPVSVWSKNL